MAEVLEILMTTYRKFCNAEPDTTEHVGTAGSNRKYVRFTRDKTSVLCVYSDNIAETDTFLYFTDVFLQLKFHVPKVYFVAEDKKSYVIEDFGDDLLLDIVQQQGFDNQVVTLYKKAISELVRMQITAAQHIDFGRAYSIGEFNEQAIMFDLNYFKYYFLNRCNIVYNEKQLQDDFEHFAHTLSLGDKFFMFRDFQARNILVKNNEVYFIDYQGGRKGAPEYDLASLLYQAKAGMPENVKRDLKDYYFNCLTKYVNIERQTFESRFYAIVYLRVLQTLGAYGFRGLIEHKSHFVESIAPALQNLKALINEHDVMSQHIELQRVIRQVASTRQFDKVEYSDFTLTVTSFSYKNGLPDDHTGNGGGFVFDCRGIHNPGRYPEFQQLTGNDKAVIDFLHTQSTVDDFMQHVIALVEPTVVTYLKRNFTSLTVSFGCTGGRHRSVYCAETCAKYFNKKYNFDIILIHREQRLQQHFRHSVKINPKINL